MEKMTRIAGVLIAMLCALALTACGSAGKAPVTQAAQGSPTPRPRPLPPVAKSSRDIMNPTFHVGQEVFITSKGFVPTKLVAIIHEKVTFINEASTTKAVHFVAYKWDSGPIPPGGKATYTPSFGGAYGYQLDGDPKTAASIVVQAYFMPGEDPAAENRNDADTPGVDVPATASP